MNLYRYRWEAFLLLIGGGGEFLYWLARTGQFNPPIFASFVRDQLGDGAAVLVATVAAIVATWIMGGFYRWLTRTMPPPPYQKWRLVAPIGAWLVFFLNEMSHAPGIHLPYGGKYFDPWSLVVITGAGVFSTLAVIRAGKAHQEAKSRPTTVWRTAMALAALTGVVLATGAGAGGSGGPGSATNQAFVRAKAIKPYGELEISVDYPKPGNFIYRNLAVKVFYRPDGTMRWDQVEHHTYDTTHMDGVDVPVKNAVDVPGQFKVTVESTVGVRAGKTVGAKLSTEFSITQGGGIEDGGSDESAEPE